MGKTIQVWDINIYAKSFNVVSCPISRYINLLLIGCAFLFGYHFHLINIIIECEVVLDSKLIQDIDQNSQAIICEEDHISQVKLKLYYCNLLISEIIFSFIFSYNSGICVFAIETLEGIMASGERYLISFIKQGLEIKQYGLLSPAINNTSNSFIFFQSTVASFCFKNQSILDYDQSIVSGNKMLYYFG
ncbi:hypothetical protein ABPG72_017528 [Tetrahymena utriculariae]